MAAVPATARGAAILEVAGVTKRFGGLTALSDVSFSISRGEIYGLIGPNGAGKTTFFNVITGLYTPDSGSFELAGKPYQPTAVHEVAKAGIARTFQNIRLFSEMTALENVMVGRHIRTHSGVFGAMLRTRSFKAEERPLPTAPRSCSTTWASENLPTTRRARSRTATSAGSKLRAHWPPTRSSSRSTSPPPA